MFLAAPTAPPENVRVQNYLSPHSVRVHWDPVPRDEQNGKITGYRVKYSLLKIGDESPDSKEHRRGIVIEEVKGNARSTVLTNLEVFGDYNVQIQALTKVGFGPWSEAVKGRKYQYQNLQQNDAAEKRLRMRQLLINSVLHCKNPLSASCFSSCKP